MEKSAKKPPKRIICAGESAALAKTNAIRAGSFAAGDSCVSCVSCATVCPKNNIRLVDGKPVFGKNCIGCLSCVQYCPQGAINVGKITEKRERYHNPNISMEELNSEIIHID